MSDDRSRDMPNAATPIAWGLAAAASAGVLAWFVSRGRQRGIDARTRDRLVPRPSERRVPSAADIHVA